MPSLHIAWAAWSAFAVWQVFRHRRGAVVVFVYPVMTALAVMSTANHFLSDVVAGALTLVLATVIADRGHGLWNRWADRRARVAAVS
jgi:membrane-associated phospholipid phosphatase